MRRMVRMGIIKKSRLAKLPIMDAMEPSPPAMLTREKNRPDSSRKTARNA